MTDIQFDEEQEFSRPIALPKQSTFVRLVLKTGIIKTEQGANYFLLGLVVICVCIIFFVVTSQGHTSSSSAVLGPPRITPNP